MPASNTPKKPTTNKSKNSSAKKKSGTKSTLGKKTKGKQTAVKQSISSGFQTEIILLILMAGAIILMVSCMGLGGTVGSTISRVLMGVMGLMAYVFPIALFIGAAFLISNKNNVLAYKKTAAAAVLFLIICGLLQLFTEGYTERTTLSEYYRISSEYHTGGGVIGGAICISTISAFGTVGAYVIIVLVILVCLILITQHSFLGFLYKMYDHILNLFKETHQRYQDGVPERQMKKKLKAQRKQMAAQERRARRMEELEAALAEEEIDIPKEKSAPQKRKTVLEKKAASVQKGAVRKRRRTPEENSAGFLEGTDLSGVRYPGEEEEKNGFLKEEAQEFTEMQEPTAEDDLSVDAGAAHEDTQLKFSIHRSEPEPEEEEQEELAEPSVENASKETSDEMAHTFETQTGRMTASQGETQEPDTEEKASRQPARNPKSTKQEIQNGIVNIQHEINTQENAVKKEYKFPPLKLLKRGNGKTQGDSDAHLKKTAQKLQDILYNFGVNAAVTNVSCGPTVTRYELQPEMGVKVSKIVGLSDDIKLNLAAPDIRIEAPIPGKAAVGIEVPNKEHSAVMLRDLIQSPEFQQAKSKLAFAAGKDIEGKTVVTDIAKMPHLLIAGSTGSGKSVCINTLIISILYKAKPDEVKLIMIDPKVVELSVYNGIPHLFIPVVTDPKKAAGALNWAVSEMSNRYNTFAEYGVRNLEEFNKKIEHMSFSEEGQRPDKMCQIVIIVDELADLMMVAPGDVEDAICRLAQLARAAGIHLVIATQRPSVNVITGLIKANMPSRIAFAVTSGVDSRTILDMNGAEKLLGKGDMLFYPQGYQKPARLQGAFVSDEEVSDIVSFLKDENQTAPYDDKIEQQMNNVVLTAQGSSGADERDVYFEQAGRFIIEKEKASIGMLQRMYKIGFNRAARIMDQLCDAGVVGPEEGTKPRKVLMSMEEFQTYVEEHL